MINKRTLVMPPIYRFDLAGYQEQSKWGWHRATELVEAINEILALQGRRMMSPTEINETYPFIKLTERNSRGYSTNVVKSDWSFGNTGIGQVNWLNTLVTHDMYLPAKIGMTLINAVKHPAVTKLKNLLAGN